MGKIADQKRAVAADLRAACVAGIDAVLADPVVTAAADLLDTIGADMFGPVEPGDPMSYVRAQVLRSSGSSAANLAEGCGRYSSGDRRRFYCIARGSAYETVIWLRAISSPRLPAAMAVCRLIDKAIIELIDRGAPAVDEPAT